MYTDDAVCFIWHSNREVAAMLAHHRHTAHTNRQAFCIELLVTASFLLTLMVLGA